MSDYTTGASLLATIGVSSPSSQQTSDATASVTAASRAIDNICNRRFYQDSQTVVRYYSPAAAGHLDVADVSTTTGLVVVSRDDGGNVDTVDSGLQTWTINTDFIVEPQNAQADADQWPYSQLSVLPSGSYTFNTYYPRSVKVTAKWGWPTVPAGIVDAATLLAERLYKIKREAPLGVISLADMAVTVGRADSSIFVLLSPYIKHRAAVA